MSARVVIPGERSTGGGGRRPAGRIGSDRLWSVLAWIGFILAAMGAVDVALTWYPVDFGNAEWEFGTVTQSLNGLPTVTMGLALWLVGALVLGRDRLAMVLAMVFVALGVVVAVAALLYATTVPLAVGSVQGAMRTGLIKAIAKTTAQSILYPLVFVVVGVKGLRAVRRGGRGLDTGTGGEEEQRSPPEGEQERNTAPDKEDD